MRKLTLVSLLAVLALLLAACGGGGSGSTGSTDSGTTGTDSGSTDTTGDTGTEAGATTDVTVDGTNDLKYAPDALTASVGETLNITLNNPSALEHNWIWTEGDEEFIPTVAPGASGANSRTFDSAGAYEFYCSIPGHREAGMVGTVTVE